MVRPFPSIGAEVQIEGFTKEEKTEWNGEWGEILNRDGGTGLWRVFLKNGQSLNVLQSTFKVKARLCRASPPVPRLPA